MTSLVRAGRAEKWKPTLSQISSWGRFKILLDFCTPIKLNLTEHPEIEQNITPTSEKYCEWTLLWVAILPSTNHNTYSENFVNAFFLSVLKKKNLLKPPTLQERKNYFWWRAIKSTLLYLVTLKRINKRKKPLKKKACSVWGFPNVSSPALGSWKQ